MPTVQKQSSKPSKKGGGFIQRIVDVQSLEDTGYKVLIFGLSGTGKTTLGCSFTKPLLMLRPERAEDGTRSVRKVEGVKVADYMTEPDQILEIIEAQENGDFRGVPGGRFKTILLDGVTQFQDLVLKKVLNLSEIPEQLSWGIADQQTWGIVSNEFKEYMRKLLRLSELGTHIVIVGGERALNVDVERPESLLAPTVMVALTPTSMAWLHIVMDYNLHTFLRRKTQEKEMVIGGKKKLRQVFTDGVDFCLHVSPDPIYQIKFRAPKGTVLPPYLVNPSFDKIDALIRGQALPVKKKVKKH